MLTTALSTHDWHSRHLKSKAARKRREHGQRKEGYTCRSPRAHRASQLPYILAHNAGKYPPTVQHNAESSSFGSGSVYTPRVRRSMKDAAWPHAACPGSKTRYWGTIIHSKLGRYLHTWTGDFLAITANYARSGMLGHMLWFLALCETCARPLMHAAHTCPPNTDIYETYVQ
jgi:hypothetical protein